MLFALTKARTPALWCERKRSESFVVKLAPVQRSANQWPVIVGKTRSRDLLCHVGSDGVMVGFGFRASGRRGARLHSEYVFGGRRADGRRADERAIEHLPTTNPCETCCWLRGDYEYDESFARHCIALENLDRALPSGSDTNPLHLDTEEVFNVVNVLFAVLGKLVKVGDLADIRLPSGQGLVDDLDFRQALEVGLNAVLASGIRAWAVHVPGKPSSS